MEIYPGASPEFRVLLKKDGTVVIQVKYVKKDVGYATDWIDIPVVKEE